MYIACVLVERRKSTNNANLSSRRHTFSRIVSFEPFSWGYEFLQYASAAAPHQNSHWMRVRFEALVEADEMFMYHCFVRHLLLKLHGFFDGGELTVLQQVRHFCEAALFGELFDRISTIEQDTFFAIYVRDFGLAAGRRREPWIEGAYSCGRLQLSHVNERLSCLVFQHGQFHGGSVRHPQFRLLGHVLSILGFLSIHSFSTCSFLSRVDGCGGASLRRRNVFRVEIPTEKARQPFPWLRPRTIPLGKGNRSRSVPFEESRLKGGDGCSPRASTGSLDSTRPLVWPQEVNLLLTDRHLAGGV
eukprot:scaffold1052_cov339-Pavlova_lutheri.AAC.54